jgi:transposase
LYLDFGFRKCGTALRPTAIDPSAGGWLPVKTQATTATELWDQPPLRHERPHSRSVPIAWTRKVTVADIICGVDIGAKALDARIDRNGAWQQFERTETGIAELASFCKHHQVGLVVMEATGGYERLPFALLWAAGLPVAIVNPRSVRRFAEAMGKLEKTDRIDCGMIVWYAQTRHIQPQPPASTAQQRLTALVVRLRQLTDVQSAQKNQRRLVTDPETLETFTAVLKVVTQQMRALERKIVALIDADPLWAALDEAFREIKGVAGRTVARLMADLPEIGTLSGKAVGKLNGLAPIARDSGQKNGKRPVRGGRESVRSILYLIVTGVQRWDPDFKAFYDRLKAAGKPPKVIRIALARKLLVRLNAKARDVRRALAEAA